MPEAMTPHRYVACLKPSKRYQQTARQTITILAECLLQNKSSFLQNKFFFCPLNHLFHFTIFLKKITGKAALGGTLAATLALHFTTAIYYCNLLLFFYNSKKERQEGHWQQHGRCRLVTPPENIKCSELD